MNGLEPLDENCFLWTDRETGAKFNRFFWNPHNKNDRTSCSFCILSRSNAPEDKAELYALYCCSAKCNNMGKISRKNGLDEYRSYFFEEAKE